MTSTSFLGNLGLWTLISSVVLLLAFLATLMSKSLASLRHFIWVTAFGILLVVPAVCQFVPAKFTFVATTALVEVPLDSFSKIDNSSDVAPNVFQTAAPVAEPFDWKPALSVVAWIWVIGFFTIIAKAMSGVFQANSMRRESQLKEIANVHLPRRNLEVRVSTSRRPPSALTWGTFRPVVILPQESENWSPEKLKVVMLHEFAHVRRLDSLSQLLALGICAVYWFNPLVWLAAKRLRADAEMAADDAAIRSGISPVAYAAELLKIATEFGHQRQPLSTIGVSLMKQSQIETRIMSIVDPTNRRRGVAKIQGISVVALGAIAAVLIVALRPGIATAQAPQVPLLDRSDKSPGIFEEVPVITEVPVQLRSRQDKKSTKKLAKAKRLRSVKIEERMTPPRVFSVPPMVDVPVYIPPRASSMPPMVEVPVNTPPRASSIPPIIEVPTNNPPSPSLTGKVPPAEIKPNVAIQGQLKTPPISIKPWQSSPKLYVQGSTWKQGKLLLKPWTKTAPLTLKRGATWTQSKLHLKPWTKPAPFTLKGGASWTQSKAQYKPWTKPAPLTLKGGTNWTQRKVQYKPLILTAPLMLKGQAILPLRWRAKPVSPAANLKFQPKVVPSPNLKTKPWNEVRADQKAGSARVKGATGSHEEIAEAKNKKGE